MLVVCRCGRDGKKQTKRTCIVCLSWKRNPERMRLLQVLQNERQPRPIMATDRPNQLSVNVSSWKRFLVTICVHFQKPVFESPCFDNAIRLHVRLVFPTWNVHSNNTYTLSNRVQKTILKVKKPLFSLNHRDGSNLIFSFIHQVTPKLAMELVSLAHQVRYEAKEKIKRRQGLCKGFRLVNKNVASEPSRRRLFQLPTPGHLSSTGSWGLTKRLPLVLVAFKTNSILFLKPKQFFHHCITSTWTSPLFLQLWAGNIFTARQRTVYRTYSFLFSQRLGRNLVRSLISMPI